MSNPRPGAEPDLDLDAALAAAVAAARAAGALIAAAWGDGAADKGVVVKSSHVDLVTETDKAAEAAIREALLAAFPGHAFVGEEEAAEAGGAVVLTDGPTWMVDPLDGTTNFVHGYPFSCVCIGLAVGQEPVVGVVFNPILGELYTAKKGGGAFCNGKRIRCSGTKDLRQALSATEIGTTRDAETVNAMFDRVRRLTAASRSLRCCGSCAMNICGVAAGRLDVFYEIGFGGCWDVAAAAIVLREAGGQLLDPSGGPWHVNSRRVLAANAHLGPAAAAILAACATSAAEPPPPPSPKP
ncbi:inositol monophosphatase [Raphidocelis subcapitata]|uniref:Inositol-1-monophosphatase n=1 Tax=Raphidocelis subcapitata TaxID=307507 RepID=A0A2V0NNY4_9CHLO|nr:inositol monophosphatase [Raphidocelis subcapitata]|eukprot:GBF89321.1 inositol monophosphatase [Raphidocelis subcapitata]